MVVGKCTMGSPRIATYSTNIYTTLYKLPIVAELNSIITLDGRDYRLEFNTNITTGSKVEW